VFNPNTEDTVADELMTNGSGAATVRYMGARAGAAGDGRVTVTEFAYDDAGPVEFDQRDRARIETVEPGGSVVRSQKLELVSQSVVQRLVIETAESENTNEFVS
jgi:hypothetical protein